MPVLATRGKRRAWAACAAALAVLALSAAAPATAPAQLPHNFWGVVPIEDPTASEYELMGAGRVGSLRQLVLWQEIEPQPGQFTWAELDFVVAQAAENGIEVMPFLYGTPRWVPGIKCKKLNDEKCQRVPPLAPDAQQRWLNFVRMVVSRYGTNGSFWSDETDAYEPPYLPITKWQIWNEPSSRTYYRPKPKHNGYATLLKISHDAIEAVDPAAQIVLAGVFPKPEGGPRYWYTSYLKRLYRVPGIEDYFDIAALHPYARTVAQLQNQIGNVRAALRKGGGGDKPLLITELGWGSDPPVRGRPLLKGLDGQRSLLESAFRTLQARAGEWNLAGVLWYSWRDPGYTYFNCTFCSSAGLLQAGGEPKPAWTAFTQITGGSAVVP